MSRALARTVILSIFTRNDVSTANCLLGYSVTCLIFSGLLLRGVGRIKSGRKMEKIVVPDLRVDRCSVQCAKGVSKLCSNRGYFYDQS